MLLPPIGKGVVFKYFFVLFIFVFSFCTSFTQNCFTTPCPVDGSPGAILVVTDNIIFSVNMKTGSMVQVANVPLPHFVVNDLAINPVTNMIYFVPDDMPSQIDYYNITTKTFGVLTNGLVGVTLGPNPNISQSAAAFDNNGNLYVAHQNPSASAGSERTRIYKLVLNATGTAVVSSTDYIQFTNHSGGTKNLQFGDFVFDPGPANRLLCQFIDGNYEVYNLPPGSPIIPVGPNIQVFDNVYEQMASDCDGKTYAVGTYDGIIYRYTNLNTGTWVYSGVTLAAPAPLSNKYTDAAGPVPASAKINGNLRCIPNTIPVEVYYDVNQNGTFEAGVDRFVTSVMADAIGNFSVPLLIPDYYLIRIHTPFGDVVRSTKAELPIGYLNIGDSWPVSDILFDPVTIQYCYILPISLTASAVLNKNTVDLKWSSTDANGSISNFEVEKSADGIHWQNIGKVNIVAASNTSDYKWNDPIPIPGNNYYRIRQNNLNGNFQYSNIEKIDFNNSMKTVIIYPVTGPAINVKCPAVISKPASLQMFNTLGQNIFKASVQPGIVEQKFELPRVAKGIYYVKIHSDEINAVQKVIIN